jgi:uncharacterized protein (UPF0218 family)
MSGAEDAIWILPEEYRNRLKVPLGDVIQDSDLERVIADKIVTVVGDFASVHVVRAGFRPKLVIVDFKTRRKEEDSLEEEVKSIGEAVIKAVNPPAQITRSLFRAIEQAYSMDKTVRIEVDGEEDLAFLPCVLLAPEGSYVIYGLPGKGMVATLITPDIKEYILSVLREFERKRREKEE